MSTEQLFLFDISAYLHRAMYVSYGDRAATTAPTDTAFIRHACTMLANTMDTLSVKRMAVMVDSTEPSVRCDVFPAYKADRKEHYPVFAAQMPRFLDALREVSVAVVEVPRYEADDLIAAMVHDVGDSLTIVSSDKDLLALVDDNRDIGFWDPMKGKKVSSGDVREKFGVDARQLYDYIGLVGDTSDGIPGVPGFGAKTVSKLLREFYNLDEVYSPDRRMALHEVLSPKQAEKLLSNQEVALLSRHLARPFIPDGFVSPQRDELGATSSAIVRRACSSVPIL